MAGRGRPRTLRIGTCVRPLISLSISHPNASMPCTPARCGAPGDRRAPSPLVRASRSRIEPGLAEWDQNSPEYIPVEELKAANDPRWRALVDGHWDSDEDEETFRRRAIDAIESIIVDAIRASGSPPPATAV